MELTANDDALGIKWTAAARAPKRPKASVIYAVLVDRYDAAGNGPTWQIGVKWDTTQWIAFVFEFDAGQTALEAPMQPTRSVATSVPWSMIGGRATFNWNAAAEWNGASSDEVKGKTLTF